jgi:hypothetical protein
MVYPSQPRHAGKYSLPLPIVTMHDGFLPAVDFPHDPNPVIPTLNVVSPRYLDSAFDVAPAFRPAPADLKVGAPLSNELRDTTLASA